MLGLGLIEYDQLPADEAVARYVDELFAHPLVAELRSSIHFIVQFVSDDLLPLTNMFEFSTAFEALVPADAHLVWSMCTNPQATKAQVVVIASHAQFEDVV